MRQLFVINPHMIRNGDVIQHHNPNVPGGSRSIQVDKIEPDTVQYGGTRLPVFRIVGTDTREQLKNRTVMVMAPCHVPWYVARDLDMSRD